MGCIIYGPNEGKSTILRALSDALFGIPHNSPDSFRHEPGKLRIAAGVSLADGTKLEFIRRKGRKSTILDPEGKPLPDEVLYPYTAGLSRSDFEDMFGLDHQRLREGGRRLLESGGSLGQSLFEAASGVRHLREVLADLDRKSGELFKPAGRNPTANRLAESYIESKRSIVPTEEELTAARTRRDQVWRLVLKYWIHQRPDLEGEKKFAPDKPLHAAYAESVTYADEVADGLRRDSDRAAKKQSLEDQIVERWRALWASVGIDPLGPREMNEWLCTATEIVRGGGELREVRIAADSLQQQIEQFTADLQAALAAVGTPASGSLGVLLDKAREVCRTADQRRGQYKTLTQTVQDQEQALGREQARLRAAEQAKADWARRWAKAAEQVFLPSDATVAVAQRYLADLQELRGLLLQLAEDAERAQAPGRLYRELPRPSTGCG